MVSVPSWNQFGRFEMPWAYGFWPARTWRPWFRYASMSREKIVRAKNCGSDQIATAQFVMRIPPDANSYLPRYSWAGRRKTRPNRNQPQIIPQAPRVSRIVAMITPTSVVRNGASHWAELIPEFDATQPTDQDPIVSTTEPTKPTTMAGQACIFVPRSRAFSKVVINGFHSISLISMTLGINVSPD